MIIDLIRFINEHKHYWAELASILDSLEKNPHQKMSVYQINNFHDLYQRASADLSRISTFSSEENIRLHLESLVARAYGEIYETSDRSSRFRPFYLFINTFPKTVRRHSLLLLISFIITLSGMGFGALALGLDPEAKKILMPFPHLLTDPSERVNLEEETEKDRLKGSRASFSSYLITHNIRVSIAALALGMTLGIGTVIILFTNGIMLGAVAADYILAGQTKFLLGWLLPHGVIEIPAILLAGQAGLLLAKAIIIKDGFKPVKQRLKSVSKEVVTMIFGVAIMLFWAGLIEAFLSQYHEPIVPYSIKIGFGTAEFILLMIFFFRPFEVVRNNRTNQAID